MNSEETSKTNGRQIKKIRKRKIMKKPKKKLSLNNESSSKMIKNVSWKNEESPEFEKKKQLPSTPYPSAVRKAKIASHNSTPIFMSLDSNDSDDDISSIMPVHADKFETHDKKRKRSKKESTWIITSGSKIKPDKTNRFVKEKSIIQSQKKLKTLTKNNKNSNKRIVNTRNGSYIFDDDTSKQLTNQIGKNMFKDEAEEILSTDSDSESPDELIPIYSNVFSSSTIVFESSSSESSDSNLSIPVNPPKIILNKKCCTIIEPEVKLLKIKDSEISPSYEKIDNLSVMKKMQLNDEIRKDKLRSSDEIRKDKLQSIVEIKKPLTKIPNINILEKIEYFLGDTYCIIILKHPFKLYFNGKLSVTVLSGAIEVLGYKLTFNNKREFEIYNPRGQSFLCLETLKSERNSNISNILQDYLRVQEVTRALEKLKTNDCVIAVRNLKNKMTEYLEKHIAQRLYPNGLQFNKRPLLQLESKLYCLFEVETALLKLYKKHEDWPKLVNSSLLKVKENNSRTILCGGKGVGKSTLLRYMINNLLNQINKVVCIDLDPGQSEFSISGCVSICIIDSPIFGPNYTHLKNPEKSFFVGDVSVTNVLDRYIISITHLINYCEQNISKDLPWIINTMGFSKSIGTDIIVLIIKLLKPSIVVQLESLKYSQNYNSHLTEEYVQNFKPSFPFRIKNNKITYQLEIIKSLSGETVPGEWISEPRMLREMCILSYFSQMLNDRNEITALAPYGVKLSSIKLHNINYSKEHILATLNSNLVALCDKNTNLNESNTPFSCHGFGIVRGIDKESGELYLLTPVSENQLENINTLIRGNIALPPSIFMTIGHQGLVPYIQLGTLQGTRAIPKRSFISWKVLLNKK